MGPAKRGDAVPATRAPDASRRYVVNVLEHLVQRPAVEQQVMVAPEEEIPLVAEPRQHEAAQRRHAKVEALGDVLLAQPFDRRGLFVWRETAPVLFAPWQGGKSLNTTCNGRDRPSQKNAVRNTSCRETMSRHVAQRGGVDGFLEDEAELLEIFRPSHRRGRERACPPCMGVSS
jgi:hypothetical protein